MKNQVKTSSKFSANILSLIIVLISLLIISPFAYALDDPAISVTPGVVNVELTQTGQTVENEIEISSNYEVETTLDTSLSGVDDSTGVIVANGPLDDQLQKSLSLSSSQVVVPAKGKAVIGLKVTNTDSLSPGGHYAAITLTQASNNQAQVNLQSTISISVFIVKRGGEIVDVSITNQILKLSPFSIASSSTLTFENTGNVHITPRASVTVRSIDGKTVYAKGISNQGSLSILPGKTLDDSFQIAKIANLPIIPTKLKYIIEYRADNGSESRYNEIQAWYIPPLFILFVIILLIFTIILIVRRIKSPTLKTTGRKSKPEIIKKTNANLISDITPAPKKDKT